MLKSWISRPSSEGDDTYNRGSNYRVVSGVFDVIADTNNPLVTGCTIRAMGPAGELANSGPLTVRPFTWACPTTTLPEGNVVFAVETTPATPSLHMIAVVDNDGVRQAPGDVWVPFGARNLVNEWIDSPFGAANGYQWRKYVPGTRPQGTKLTVRRGSGPVNIDIKHKSLWQQAMACSHLSYSFPSREPVQMVPSGAITSYDRQTYDHTDSMSLYPGTCVDGPYGVGRVGSWSSGVPHPDGSGAVVLCCPIGRIVRVDLDGAVTTLLGVRLKANVYPPPRYFDAARTNDQSALAPYYENVGGVRPNNPWQVEFDPRDANVLYWTDTDNDRVGITNLTTLVTRFITGFDRPRGIAAYPDGSGMAIGNDHASEICKIAWDDSVVSVVKSARGNNYDLVVAQSRFTSLSAYVAHIRTFMLDGAFGVANFMHPNSLAFDSQGRLLAVCHHPHVVVRFDLVARTVTTILSPTVNADINYLKNSWCSLSVNRWGDDSFAIAWWLQNSMGKYKSDGTGKTEVTGPDEAGQVRAWMETGPANYCSGSNGAYPQGVLYTPESFWHGGWAGEGACRQTLAKAGDPVVDIALYNLGQRLYLSGTPAPFYTVGWRGINKTGGRSFWDLASLTDAGIDAAIRDEWQLPALLTHPDIGALRYFIRIEATGALPSGAIAPPPPPPPPPPPVDPCAAVKAERDAALARIVTIKNFVQGA